VKHSIFSTGAALAVVLAGAPAQADISPAEAWENMTKFSTLYGYEVSVGGETDTGQSLKLTDIVFSMSDEEVEFSETIPWIELKQAADGSVTMTAASKMGAEMTMKSEFDGPVTIPMMVALDGFEGVLDKNDGLFSVSYKFAGADVSISEIIQDGDSEPMSLNFDMKGLVADVSIGENFEGAFSSAFSIENIDIDGEYVGTKENDPQAFSGTANYKGLSSVSAGDLPAGMDMSDPTALFTSGASMSANVAHQGGNFEFSFADGSDNGSINFSNDSGTMNFGLNAEGVSFAGVSSNLKALILGSSMPLPSIGFSAKETSFGFGMPLVKSETPSDFLSSIKLTGLTVSEGIWGMVDPSKVLPRDPANLVIDLSGKVAVLVDLFNEEEMMQSGEPAQIHALDVNEIRLNVAGADLTGSGAFTFDNNARSPFGVGPKPAGALDLALTGGNGLIDNLVSLGLLPQDQAMAGRMMMGLFAKPGEGEDSLTSKIEITEEGGILANGQRLQ